MKYDTHEVVNGFIQVRYINDGEYHRYVLSPGDSLENEVKAVKEAAEKAWTPEVIAVFLNSNV
jgi:hypothetical protein